MRKINYEMVYKFKKLISPIIFISLFSPLSKSTLAEDINNYSSLSTDDISNWGGGSTNTYGQTFTPAESSSIQSFSFWLKSVSSSTVGDTAEFKAYIFPFSSSNKNVTGSAIFTSPTQTYTSTSDFNEIKINVNGTANVEAGNEYILTLSTEGLDTSGGVSQRWAWTTQLSNSDQTGNAAWHNSQSNGYGS